MVTYFALISIFKISVIRDYLSSNVQISAMRTAFSLHFLFLLVEKSFDSTLALPICQKRVSILLFLLLVAGEKRRQLCLGITEVFGGNNTKKNQILQILKQREKKLNYTNFKARKNKNKITDLVSYSYLAFSIN